MIWKRIIASALAVCLTFGAVPLTDNIVSDMRIVFAAEEQSGTCGDDLTWHYDGSGMLTISGTGNMQDWSSSKSVPWYDVKSNIKNVIIEKDVTSIGAYSFYECTNITSVKIPETVTVIGSDAFYKCSKLTDVVVLGAKVIDNGAFWYCSNLQSIELSEEINKIGNYCFYGCTNLQSINLPEGLISIGRSVFSRCSSLKEITIPKSVTEIEQGAFEECTGTENIYVVEGNTMYTSVDGVIFSNNRKTLLAYPIGSTRTEYTIPDGVTYIAHWAFEDAVHLTKVDFPDSVSSIANYAFEGCSGLLNLELPPKITQIGVDTFRNCTSFTSVSVPENVTFYSTGAFYGCFSLTSFTFSENVKTITNSVLDGCNSLKMVIIKNPDTEIKYESSISETATIYGYANSTAQAYAEQYNRRFIALDEDGNIPETIPFVNEYTGPSLEDIKAIQAFLLNSSYYGSGDVSDINGDGKIDVFDLVIAKRQFSEYYSQLNNSVSLINFLSDEDSYLTNNESEIIFTVEAYNISSVINLYNGSHNVGQMHDDGKNGDETAGDGIYTYVYRTKESSAKTVTFMAKADTVESNSVDIMFFNIPTKSDYQKYEEIQSALKNVLNTYIDADGYVAEKDVTAVLDAIEAKAENLYQNGELLSYERDETSVLVRAQSGMYVICSIPIKDKDAAGSTKNISTFQPCIFTYNGLDTYMEKPDNAATTIVNNISKYQLKYNLDNEEATLKKIVQAINSSDVVLWHGHGSMYNHKFYGLQTAIPYDSAVDGNEILNFLQGRLLADDNGYTVIMHNYILNNCDLPDNSFVYLAACGSLQNKKMANAFIARGAKAVVGASETINTIYDLNMMETIMTKMSEINPKTYQYYTVSEALVFAKNKHGANDGNGAYITIHGDKNYRLVDSVNYYGKLVKSSLSNVGVTGAEIKIYKADELFRTIKSGSDGNFSLTLPKGAYKFVISASGYVEKETFVEVVSGTSNTVLNPNLIVLSEVASGEISGKVCKASDRSTPITIAKIAAYQNKKLIKSTTCDSKGNYTLSVPEGRYQIKIIASGYISFDNYVDVEADETTYLETFLLVEDSGESECTASGQIINALTGSGLGDVTLTIRDGWNNKNAGYVIKTITTDSNGKYSVTLPIGNYTLYAEKEGYISSVVNIVVNPGTMDSQNGSISPIIDGDDFRIVLTWGSSPEDLDSHLNGAYSSGSRFEVYYSDKSKSENGITLCNLDVDDTDGYGPETTTLHVVSTETYYYYVYQYSGSGSLLASEAQVKVYQGEKLLATYNVPTDQGRGRYWNVFAIINGKIVTKNTITSSEDTSYTK